MKHKIRNVLSVDVEDYFQVEAFASVVSHEQWDSYELRVERNVHRILDLFAKYNATATFFVLGWVAEKLPKLVPEIASAGHEIGSHGYAHQRLIRLKPEEFRVDIRKTNARLEDQSGRRVRSYRAPSFSVMKQTLWALDVLAEEDFRCDSSVFPIRHDLYGVPDAERAPHWRTTEGGRSLFEFPPSTVRYGKNNWPVGGGGYLRLFPYAVTKWALTHINEVEQQPAMIYFHPWEIDYGQPRIQAGLKSTFRHYTNIAAMEGKIESLLKDFSFTTISGACDHYTQSRPPLTSQARTMAVKAGARG